MVKQFKIIGIVFCEGYWQLIGETKIKNIFQFPQFDKKNLEFHASDLSVIAQSVLETFLFLCDIL